jgi:diguanylate cyclase (GGDEF)-like protein
MRAVSISERFAAAPRLTSLHPTEPPHESEVGASQKSEAHTDARAADPLDGQAAGRDSGNGPVTDRCGPLEPSPLDSRAPRDRGVLVRLDGYSAGQVECLTGRDQRVGRASSAGIHLAEIGVSRFHARLGQRDGAFWIEDLASLNGTFVNGERVVVHELREGDLVQFGPRATFRFSVMDERQEAAMRRLYESSIHDVLTGAYNRRFLEDRLRAEIAFALRHRTHCAVVLFDIDHFKKVNDTHGHRAGDLALKHVVSLCIATLRAEDVFARYGGEEFMIALRDIGIEGGRRAAQRILDSLRGRPVDLGHCRLPLTMSAGVAALSDCPRPSVETLVFLADRRLYAAKHLGRDRVVTEDG